MYLKFIKDVEFETRKLFEQKIIERKNIRNIETRLKMTRLDKIKLLDQKIVQHVAKSTDLKWTYTLIRHKLIHRIHCHQTHHLKERKSKIIKSVLSIRKMNRQTHPQVMTLIHPRTGIIGINDAKIRNIGNRIRSDYAKL